MQHSILFRKNVALLLLAIFSVWQVGCSRYYMVQKPAAPNEGDKAKLINEKASLQKVFLLHGANKVVMLKEVKVNDQQYSLEGKSDKIPPEHTVYINDLTKSNPKYRYTQSKGEEAVLREVHLYAPGMKNLADSGENVVVKVADIEKVEVIEFDKGRTNTSFVLGGLGITLGVLVIAAGITAAVSSCPYISTVDGTTTQLQGELFGGAIYPSLERDDYLPINSKSNAGEITLKISNELPEEHHTNLTELMVIDHAAGTEILPDMNGQLQTIRQLQKPVTATLNGSANMLEVIGASDKKSCIFNMPLQQSFTNDLVLNFEKPVGVTNSKLVLELRNSYWGILMIEKFEEAFGGRYNDFKTDQKKRPAEEIENWMKDQKLPLEVSIKTKDGWKTIEHVPLIGPVLNRKMVIPMDLAEVTNNKVEVKLSSGFMFWELDLAGMDFSKNPGDLAIQVVKPTAVTDQDGASKLPQLLASDNQYLHQPNKGNSALMVFEAPAKKPDMQRTLILHTRGYYEHIRNFTGKPKVAFLKQFKEPGFFSQYSQAYFKEVSQNNYAVHE